MCHLFSVNNTDEFREQCLAFRMGCPISSLQKQKQHNDVLGDEDTIINLLTCFNESPPVKVIGDMWLQFAHKLYSSIEKMSSLLESKKVSYCRAYDQLSFYDFDVRSRKQNSREGNMINVSSMYRQNEDGDNEAKKFEESITEFVTSFASQIDSLRVSLNTNSSSVNKDSVSHRNGIISHLVTQLQELIVDKFSEMQKVRNRKTLELWNNPFRINAHSGNTPQLNESSIFQPQEDDLWKNMARQAQDKAFIAMYEHNEEKDKELQRYADMDLSSLQICPLELNLNIDVIDSNSDEANDENAEDIPTTTKDTPTMTKDTTAIPNSKIIEQNSSSIQYTNTTMNYEDNEVEMDHIEELQKESAYLKAKIESTQLDSVQKVESQMMQITSLLSQFSTLVSEQQEEIINIQNYAIQSKTNMVKGNEQLIDAAQRKKKSKHFMSTIIFIMGLILLILNWIIP